MEKSCNSGIYLRKNRRSCPIVLPHNGDCPGEQYCFKNSRVSSSAFASKRLLIQSLLTSHSQCGVFIPIIHLCQFFFSNIYGKTGTFSYYGKIGSVTIVAISIIVFSSGSDRSSQDQSKPIYSRPYYPSPSLDLTIQKSLFFGLENNNHNNPTEI